jgi:hypothetical protein
MPAKIVFQLVGEVVLGAVALLAAKFLLPLITFGRVQIEDFRNPPIKFRWHGVHRLPNGQIVLHADLGVLIGLLLVVAVVAIGVFAYVTF